MEQKSDVIMEHSENTGKKIWTKPALQEMDPEMTESHVPFGGGSDGIYLS